MVLLLHHSRNSAQKQWDETLGLALGGAAKLLRQHLSRLAPLQPAWAEAWAQLMRVRLRAGSKGCVAGCLRKAGDSEAQGRGCAAGSSARKGRL